jgi:ribonuclease Z
MQNKVYAIETVLISHGHTGHIAGLPAFLRSRASSRGDRNIPLTIYYPRGDRNVYKLRRYTEDALGNLPFSVSWQELREGDRLPLAGNRSLEAFATRHDSNSLSLGYKIIEHRSRIKPAYKDLPNAELMNAIRYEGKEAVSEKYDHPLLCFSGDSMPLPVPLVENAEVLLHDATFLKAEDHEERTHATLEEVFQVASAAKVSLLGLFHFSTRYRYTEIIKAIRQNMEALHVQFPVFYLLPSSLPFVFKKIAESTAVNVNSQTVLSPEEKLLNEIVGHATAIANCTSELKKIAESRKIAEIARQAIKSKSELSPEEKCYMPFWAKMPKMAKVRMP